MRETLVKTEEFKDSPVGRIPKDWEVVKLESLLNGRPKNGYSPKEVNEWTGTLMLGLGCLTEEGFEPCQLKNAPSNDLKIRTALLSDGDFLLSRSNTRERVALAAIYRDVGVPCIYSDLMMRLSLNEKICSRFMELLLRHSPVRRQLTGNAQGTSGSMVKISSQTVMETVVLLPPRKEQDRIISVVDTLDKAIAHTSSLIAKLKQMKAGLLHDLLTRGLDENGELRDAIGHPEQFKDSPLGRIPKDWETGVLGDFVDPNRPIVYGILMPGYGYPGGIPVVKVKDIINGKIQTSDLLLTSPEIDNNYRRSRLETGDLLFTIRGTVGRMAFVPEHLRGANITQDTARLAIINANPRFVRQYLGMPKPQAFIELHTIGQAVKGINLRDVRLIPLVVPPTSEQLQIIDICDTYDNRIRAEEAYRDKLKRQKQGLMHDLLTGKVRVKNA